jgi:hypothetical protein
MSGVKRKAPEGGVEGERQAEKKCRIACEQKRGIDKDEVCWNPSQGEFLKIETCEECKTAIEAKKRKAHKCSREECELEAQVWSSLGQFCHPHHEEAIKKSQEDKLVYCKRGCSQVAIDERKLCAECAKYSEHTKDGWTKEYKGVGWWKCIQHNPPCHGGLVCLVGKCSDTPDHLVDGLFVCDYHKWRREHDKTCDGVKDNHRGCRGPVPDKCSRCNTSGLVLKCLNKTRMWLCQGCYEIDDATHNARGQFRTCSRRDCANDARFYAGNGRIFCVSHGLGEDVIDEASRTTPTELQKELNPVCSRVGCDKPATMTNFFTRKAVCSDPHE